MFTCKKSIVFNVLQINIIHNVHMSKGNIKSLVEQENNLFSEVSDFFELEKPVEISFTAPDLSSLGGLALVSKTEKSCGIINSISRCIEDWRDQNLIVHSIKDMVGQRVMQIACGYEDTDDCDPVQGRERFQTNEKVCENLLPILLQGKVVEKRLVGNR